MTKGLSSKPTAYRPTLNNLRGIIWMLMAVTALTAMFAVVKQMAMELPVFVVAIMRTASALMFLAPWMMRVGISGMVTRRPGGHFLRAFFGISSFVCVVYALSELLMADAVVLAFTSPLWSIIISAVMLGEVAGPRRIIATAVGFAGVLLIVKPQLGLQPAMLVALGSAVFTSLAMITMKRLSASEPPTRIVFYFFFFGTLLLLPGAILTWQTPTWTQFG
ncbi:MAG: DMT family transporter, partial [Geminicoccales bacterium]